eukprot:Phypoly_transcript_02164.p1 GENE.Phypoly_transcript_02164~~Phypoly_transcript_02164.p1  ORF type:complete len:933 (+),score=137.18 Phypoly_transcript_02164:88-2886(+)
MNPAQELQQLPTLSRSSDAQAQQRFHECLARVCAWDTATLHQYFNDVVNGVRSCLSPPGSGVQQRSHIFSTIDHLLSLASGHQIVGPTLRPLWVSVVAQSLDSVQFVEGSLGNLGMNPNIDDLSLAINEQRARVKVFHTLLDRIKELFREIPLPELRTVFEALFTLFCGSMHKIQEFSPILAGANFMDLAKSNDELRDFTAQLYVKLFKLLSSSALAFDPNSQCGELVFVCEGVLSICRLCERKNFTMLAPGWQCLKELFKHAQQLKTGNLNTAIFVDHVIDKLTGGLDEFIACAPVTDLADPAYKRGSMLLRFFLPHLRTVCATFGGDFPPSSSSLDTILDFLIRLKSSTPPSVAHYNTPQQVAKEINVITYQADLVFENLLPHLRNPALLLNKLNPSSPTPFEGGALGKLGLLALLFSHFDKCAFDPAIISECAWWILDLLPLVFPELCTPIAPVRIGKDNETPQPSLFESVLRSLLQFFSFCPDLGVDLQLLTWECLSHPFPLCAQLGVELGSFALTNGDNEFVSQNINLFLDWILKDNFDPSMENSQLGMHILQILANTSVSLHPEFRDLIASKLFSPVNTYSTQDSPIPPSVCAYFLFLRFSNFATAPYEVTSEVLPLCISKLNYCINNPPSTNVLTSTVFVLRTIFMDKKFARNNVLPALAQKVSQATVQLLSNRDSYPSHLPDVIDLAASLLVDNFNTPQRESVVIDIKHIAETSLNKENALAIADFLGNFIGFNVEASWAEHLKTTFYKIFSVNDEATILEVMRNYYHMLEFSAFRELLPGFLPDNMKGQMRAFIFFHKNAKSGAVDQLSDAQSLITQRDQLVIELRPQLAKRRRITHELLQFKDTPQPNSSQFKEPHTNGTTKISKPKEEMKKIVQNLRNNLASLQPYTQNITREEALFLLEEIKDVGVSFYSLQEILKFANG